MGTLRQHLIRLLGKAPMDLCDLAAALGIREAEAAEHLQHVTRTLRSQGRTLKVVPAHCRQCGHAFTKRTRFTRPGRCPRCRSNRIEGAKYFIATQRR
ncbi:MAG: transcriptional regulator [Desulfosarcinaceae bacterium]|nr:transcriptional regulator [Desulfosarcinaceae bacterium]